MTDLGGILDILISFLGPTNIIVTMKRNPELIDTCRAIILEKYLKVYDELQNIINKYLDGCNTWLNVWCPKRYYTMQCDFSVMLNPKWFKRFVLPDLIEQAEHMDYSIYHLDGPGQLIHLDDLLAEPSITGIQWVPGAKDRSLDPDKWLSVYKKIQAAGKNIVVDNAGETPQSGIHLYEKLDQKGLFMSLIFPNEIRAYYHLPKFVGGNGSVSDYRTFKKEYKENLKKKKATNSD